MRKRTILTVLVSGLALIFGASPAVALGSPSRRLPVPHRQARVCDPADVNDVPPEIRYECHWVTVPEHHAGLDGDTFRLAVTVLHSTAADPAPDPVVYISGGPGGPGGSPNVWSKSPFLAERDVILYDQRGTGSSEPDLECPEIEQQNVAMFERADDNAGEEAAATAAARACHRRLVAEGRDLTAFSTPENAADLADIRAALGIREWHLFGISYGTRVALESLRSQWVGVKSVVLDSVSGVAGRTATETVGGGRRSIDLLAARCSASAACASVHPDLRGELEAAVKRFDREPHRSRVDFGPELGVHDVAVTGADIMAFVFGSLSFTDIIPTLPSIIGQLSRGDGSILDAFVTASVARMNVFAEGMSLSVGCADSSPNRAEQRRTDRTLLRDPESWSSTVLIYRSLWCSGWEAGVVDSSFVDPVVSRRPALVLSGSLDPITPTPRARRAVEQLTNATFVRFAGMGHGVWDDHGCNEDLVVTFLRDVRAPLDTSCADRSGSPVLP